VRERIDERLTRGAGRTGLRRRRLEQRERRHGVTRAPDPRVVGGEARPEMEAADAGRRVEGACGIVVDARLLGGRKAAAVRRERRGGERPLEEAVARPASAWDAVRGRRLRARRGARVARLAVRRAVVALLAARDDAVATPLDPARVGAAVARRRVAVV